MHFIAPILACFLSTAALAADPNKAHAHKGVGEKFTAPTPTVLNAKEKATLERGETVRKQIKHSSGGRGIAIMDVNASADKVWKVITDYKAYPSWIDDLESTQTYENTGRHIKVQFNLSVMMKDITYYIDHDYQPAKGYLTWQRDYRRESDIDDSTGYWLVYPTPGYEGWTRVEYTVDLRLKGWVPGILENMLAKKGLILATSWVKKQAE